MTCTGILSARVALLAEKADVSYDPQLTDPSQITSYIQSMGFNAQPISTGDGLESGVVDLEVILYSEIHIQMQLYFDVIRIEVHVLLSSCIVLVHIHVGLLLINSNMSAPVPTYTCIHVNIFDYKQ